MEALLSRFNLYSLRTQFLLTLVTVVILAVSVTQIVSVLTTRSELIQEAEENTSSLVESKRHDVGTALENQVNLLQLLANNQAIEAEVLRQNATYNDLFLVQTNVEEYLAEQASNWSPLSPTVANVLRSEASQALSQFASLVPGFSVIYVTDQQGAIVAATEFVPNYRNASNPDWINAWNNAQGAIFVAAPENPEAIVEEGLLIAVPIRDEDRMIGVLHARFDVTTLTNTISFIDGDARSFVVDREGRIILGDDLTAIGQQLTELPSIGELANIKDDRGVDSVAAIAPITSSTIDAINNLGWSAVLFEPESSVYAAANNAVNAVILPSVAIILVTLVISILFAQRLTSSVKTLTSAATRLAMERDYTTRVNIRDRSELGLLGQTFNAMAEEVQTLVTSLEERVAERVRDLEATIDIGRLVSTISDDEALLPNVVNTIRERFNLYYVQIYLLDEAQRFAILRAGTGQVGNRLLKQKHRLDMNQTSIVSRAVQSSRSVLVANTLESDIFLPNPLLPDTRSELAIPLAIGNTIFGVLDMQSSQPEAFNEENVSVFETMASQIAGVLRSNKALEEVQAAVARADELNRRLIRENWEGYLGRLARGERLGYVYDLEAPKPLTETEVDLAESEGAAQAVVPIKLGAQQIGNIIVSETVQKEWAPDELGLIEEVAERVAQAIEQLRTFDETEVRARELALVAEVSARASSTLNPTELLESIVELTKQSFDLYHVHVYLLDRQSERLVLAAGSGEAGRIMVQRRHNIRLDQSNSLVARAAREQRGIISNNVIDEPDFLPNPLLPETRSEMAIPMVARGELLGVFDLQADEFNRFSDEDLQIQTTLVSQLAVALSNAQLFEQTQVALREAALLYEASQTLSLAQNYEEVLQAFVEPLLESGAKGATINLIHYDAGTTPEYAEIVANVGELDIPITQVSGVLPMNYVALSENREEVISVKNLDSPEVQLPQNVVSQLKAWGITSIASVPLIAGRRWLGNVLILWTEQHQFSELEQRYLRQLSTQVAALVDSFVALNDSQQSAAEMRIVAEISALGGSLTQIDELLKNFADLTRERFQRYHAQIYLYLSDSERLLLTAGAGNVGDIMVKAGHSISIHNPTSLVARAARSKEPVVVNDVSTEPDFLPNPLLPETRAELAVPILLGEEIMGVLDIQDNKLGAFNDMNLRSSLTLANQIAVALQNARLFEETERRLRETQAANALAEVLRDNTRLEPMMEEALQILKDVMEADTVVFSRFDVDLGHWYGITGVGGDLTTEFVQTLTDPADAYPHGIEALETRRIITVEDVRQYPNFPMEYASEESLGLKSMMVLPIFQGRAPMGVIFLNYTQNYRHFSEAEISVAQSFTNQISAGLERIQITEEIAQRAAELQVVAEVSAAASTILDPQELLETIANLTRDNFGLYHAHIYLFDAERDALVLAAGSGEVGKMMVAAKHQIPLSQPTSLVARAARTRQGVIVNDVTLDAGFLPNPLLPETLSEMAVPIIAGNELIGVLDVQDDVVNRFKEQDVQIQMTLARQIGIALSNARLYQEQLKTAERLREVDRLKSEFLASMSHELRTPLNSIIGYAEVLLDGIDGELNDEMREDVNAIHSSGKLLLTLINDILDLAKIEAGQMELEYNEIDLDEFVNRAINSAQILLKDRPIELKGYVDENCPPTIYADEVRLQQIVNNLLSNAAKFTEEGSITLKVETYSEGVHFSVTDTGIGIAPDKLDVIFERFRQADQSSTRRAGGTGLGLDITRSLVHMHGGEITVTSELGKGSTFSFTIPYERPQQTSVTETAQSGEATD